MQGQNSSTNKRNEYELEIVRTQDCELSWAAGLRNRKFGGVDSMSWTAATLIEQNDPVLDDF